MVFIRMTRTPRFIIFRFSFLYRGMKAVQQIRVVVVPSPFRETQAATAAVAIRTLTGSPLANLIMNLVTGSNRPAFSMMAKYMMANSSMMPVLAVLVEPATVHSPMMAI